MKRTLSLILLMAFMLTAFSGVMSTTAGAMPEDTYEPLEAANEDETLELWFDHATAKVKPTDITSTGRDTYTVYMAKNDIQGAQFILFSEESKSDLTAEITAFTNGTDEIPVELFWQYYAEAVDNTPDAIPPLREAFDLTGGQSKAFYFKLKSTVETVAGDYSATLTIKDADGNEIKKATVFAHVWDFALTEETSIATAVYLSMNGLKDYYGTQVNAGATVYKQYYDYLLENRICAFDLPKQAYYPAMKEYIENPRVTSFKITGEGEYFSSLDDVTTFRSRFEDDRYVSAETRAIALEKAFFYFSDEPQGYMRGWNSGSTCNSIVHYKTESETAFPGIRFIVPFHENYPVQYVDETTGETVLKDATQFFMDEELIDIWCTKPYFYMDNKYLDLIPGTRTMNGTIAYEGNRDGFIIPSDTDWDAQYGQFIDRIKTYRAEKDIDEWWYCAGTNGGSGTANVLIENTGVSTAMLGWQMTKYDIEGWLYYHCNNWVKGEEYTTLDKGDAEKHGDGILIYPGEPIGYIDTIVGTLRLECLRDGIEDALMLRMYEKLTSTEQMQDLIDRVAQNVVLYTQDGDEFAATRIYLGNEVERLTKGETGCTHDYTEVTLRRSTTRECGKISHTCSLCGDVYFEFIDPLYKTAGDVNGDGRIGAKDVLLIRKNIAGFYISEVFEEIGADANSDGTVSILDILAIKKLIMGE